MSGEYAGRYLLGDDLSVLDLYVAVVSTYGPGRARFNEVARRWPPRSPASTPIPSWRASGSSGCSAKPGTALIARSLTPAARSPTFAPDQTAGRPLSPVRWRGRKVRAPRRQGGG